MLYFGGISLLLLGMLSFGSDSLAQLNAMEPVTLGSASLATTESAEAYFNQSTPSTIETPDLKMGGDFVYGVSTTQSYSPQTLGALMGGPTQEQNRKDITEHVVVPGDTLATVASDYGLSINTIVWANDLSKNAVLKTGQELIILPVDGLLHIPKSGDTLDGIIGKYKGNMDETLAFNDIVDKVIYTGEPIFVVAGVMPQQKAPVSLATSMGVQNVLPGSFFMPPLLKFKITQGLHYLNGVDFSSPDGCGASVHASAKGIVQKAVGNGAWNGGKGNYVTILHDNGVSTYYGHLMSLFVKPGDEVSGGTRIGLEGKTGKATGCHVHWQVMGAKNPYGGYPVGYTQ